LTQPSIRQTKAHTNSRSMDATCWYMLGGELVQ